jgi:hypothetical protein
MEHINYDPDQIRTFDPVLAELATKHRKNDIYKSHLSKVRKLTTLGISVLLFIFWLHSKNFRYQPVPNGDRYPFVLDTRTGAAYDLAGIWQGSESKLVRIKRVELGFWPYWGYWKILSEDK